jgi:hypothetical protein
MGCFVADPATPGILPCKRTASSGRKPLNIQELNNPFLGDVE